ncbi:hypothetical protein GY45DRAFT_1325551 [Cubamyces sp. BRFM 1775]|nr:hypothetical protein GY45DRAFT_1325551 [Cubamyces sp. BRFM 1775]
MGRGRAHGAGSGRGRGGMFGDQPSAGTSGNPMFRSIDNPPPTWVEQRRRGNTRGSPFGRGNHSDIGGGRGRGHSHEEFRSGRGRGRGRDEGRGEGRGRGRGRGEGRGRGRGGAPQVDVEDLPPLRDIMQGMLVPAIQELSLHEIAISDKPISIEGFRCIGSYTWLEAREPTIIVPGLPREWRNCSLPVKIYFDRGISIYYEDKFRMGASSPFLPLFRAVDAVTENVNNGSAETEEEAPMEPVDWPSIDFVTDRSNLRKLFRYVNEPYLEIPSPTTTANIASELDPSASTQLSDGTTETANYGKNTADHESTVPAEPEWDARKDFRVDLHLAGQQTVLMERWAACDRDHIIPPKGGCRDGFVREATNQGCENGAGHYRIVQYNIGGLNMVVRWEVDACVPNEGDSEKSPLSASASTDTGSPPVVTPVQSPAVDIDELARWEGTDADGAAAWGVAEASPGATDVWGVPNTSAIPSVPGSTKKEPAVTKQSVKKTVDIDTLVRWDEEIEPKSTWDVPDDPTPAGDATASCPIEQNPHAPALRSTAAASKDGGPPAKQGKDMQEDLAALWDVPTSVDDGTAWGVGPSSTEANDPSSPAPDLKVIRGGALIPQSSLIELATRSSQYVDRIKDADTFIQLFLTQSPVNLVAVHTRGVFDHVIRQELDAPEFAKFADDPEIQRKLSQFVALLREIQALVKLHRNIGTLSLICQKGKLEVYSRMESEDVLLSSELARFTRQSYPK